jgi:NOL1/NOP2/sun family putative RNA methylase
LARRRHRARERAVDLTRYRDVISDWSAFSEAASRPEPTVFRVRTGRISASELEGRLAAQGFRTRPLEGLPGFFQVEDGPFPVSLSFEHWQGLIYVQQASTGIAAPALGALPGERVLDLCSAPGGKTTHIAELMEDRGCLVANEIDERRIRGLLGNVYRLGHSGVLVVSGDGRAFPEGALFDRVLVDAPCSGEGTLRRRAGEPPNQSTSFLSYVTRAQRALLERAARLTRPGGTILYVTCTFAPEENEAVVSAALRELPVELEPLDLPVPHEPGLTAFDGQTFDARLAGAARIYPHHLDSGGLFLARLRRLDDGTAPAGLLDEGWSNVPSAFPDEGGTTSIDGASEAGARERLARALSEVEARYGVTPTGDGGRGWMVRGARAWVHALSEWPVPSWDEGAWRVVSVGQRALEFDSHGRPRPTNDYLRMVGGDVTRAVVDLTAEELGGLLRRESVTVGSGIFGPVVLRHAGEVVGRGAATPEGLVSEIPKARAADLLRALERADPSEPGRVT